MFSSWFLGTEGDGLVASDHMCLERGKVQCVDLDPGVENFRCLHPFMRTYLTRRVILVGYETHSGGWLFLFEFFSTFQVYRGMYETGDNISQIAGDSTLL
ncbi:hypothetical protein KI387_006217, partial [Taxus chinensis]